MPASQIPRESEIWELVAHALAQLVHTIVLATAPRRIAIGGGVIEGRPELLGSIRRMLVESINGYVNLEDLPWLVDGTDTIFITKENMSKFTPHW